MKKYIILIIAAVFLSVFMASCIDDPEPFPPYSNGGTVEVSNVAGFFDQLNLSGSTVSFDLSGVTPEGVSISEVIINKSFNGGAMVEHARTSATGSVSVTPASAAAGTSANASSLAQGDNFTLSFMVVTNNGTFKAKDNVSIDVTCSSSLAGTYDAALDFFNSDAGDILGLSTTVTLGDVSETVYTIDDITCGGWPLVYGTDDYGVNYGASARMTEISDNCGVISWEPTDDQFGGNIIMRPGDVSMVTLDASGAVEKIEIFWGDDTYLDEGEAVLTPQ